MFKAYFIKQAHWKHSSRLYKYTKIDIQMNQPISNTLDQIHQTWMFFH